MSLEQKKQFITNCCWGWYRHWNNSNYGKNLLSRNIIEIPNFEIEFKAILDLYERIKMLEEHNINININNERKAMDILLNEFELKCQINIDELENYSFLDDLIWPTTNTINLKLNIDYDFCKEVRTFEFRSQNDCTYFNLLNLLKYSNPVLQLEEFSYLIGNNGMIDCILDCRTTTINDFLNN